MKYSLTLLIFLSLTCLTILQAQTQASPDQQTETEVLRISTNLVTVPAIVKTHQGGYIPNLHREDFHIYEDDVEQEISHFETVDRPFTIVLLLDMSDSTRIELKEIQNAAIAFLNQLRTDDRALIAVFANRFTRLTDITDDRQALSAARGQLKAGGS